MSGIQLNTNKHRNVNKSESKNVSNISIQVNLSININQAFKGVRKCCQAYLNNRHIFVPNVNN